jgi:hypothetical protein
VEVSGQLHEPAALPLRNNPQCPLVRKLDGSKRYGEKHSRPYRDSNSYPSVVQPVTSLYRLSYCGSDLYCSIRRPVNNIQKIVSAKYLEALSWMVDWATGSSGQHNHSHSGSLRLLVKSHPRDQLSWAIFYVSFFSPSGRIIALLLMAISATFLEGGSPPRRFFPLWSNIFLNTLP